jgi:hypothetical protein
MKPHPDLETFFNPYDPAVQQIALELPRTTVQNLRSTTRHSRCKTRQVFPLSEKALLWSKL